MHDFSLRHTGKTFARFSTNANSSGTEDALWVDTDSGTIHLVFNPVETRDAGVYRLTRPGTTGDVFYNLVVFSKCLVQLYSTFPSLLASV